MKKTVATAAPKAVVCTKKAEPEAYSTKQLPIEDIDLDRDNPQLVSYYAKDIYTYLRQLEVLILLTHLLAVRKDSIVALEILSDWRAVHGCRWLHDSANHANYLG